MEQKVLYTILKTLNIPIAYDHFDKKVIPPFIAYRETPSDLLKADGKTYFRTYNYELELITTKKDMALEQQIEKLLTDNNIPYDKEEEVWDTQEKIYHNFYEI